MGDDHRGELVDLAVKGQLAPAEDDHHQHVDLVVAVRLDAVAPAEPDEVGLQVLPVEPPQRPWMVPPAARPARLTGGMASGMPPSSPTQPKPEEDPVDVAEIITVSPPARRPLGPTSLSPMPARTSCSSI
jgi:hypothetical protein